MSRSARVTVAGAGALGLTVAVALADAGCQVTLCDPAPDGGLASGVAAGMLAPVFETVLDREGPQALPLLMAARDLWPGLAARLGLDLERAGAVAVGSDAWLEGVGDDLNRLGLHGTEIGRTTLALLAPGLSEGFQRGLMTREDWRLSPLAAMTALRAAAQAAGVAFRPETIDGRGDADWLVLATGAAQALAPELASLAPIKGHILRIADPEAGPVSVRGEGIYAAPAAGGLAVGATMETGLADPRIDPTWGPVLRKAGAALFPRLASARYEIFAGVRAATPDGLPMIGASREPGLLLAAGVRRNGWLLAPLAARTIVALVTGADPGPWAAPLDPARFQRPVSA